MPLEEIALGPADEPGFGPEFDVHDTLLVVVQSLLLLLLAFLVFRALRIARETSDGLAYLMAVSIALMISTYALLNLAMVTSLIPVIGLPPQGQEPIVLHEGPAADQEVGGIPLLVGHDRLVERRDHRAP